MRKAILELFEVLKDFKSLRNQIKMEAKLVSIYERVKNNGAKIPCQVGAIKSALSEFNDQQIHRES